MTLISRKSLPSLERLNECLAYDPLKGDFRWKIKKGNAYPAGKLAGCYAGVEGQQQLQIFLDGRTYKAARLAWKIVHGADPDGLVYHLNGNTKDNSIENLSLTAPTLEKFPTELVGRTKSRVLPPITTILAAVSYDPETGLFRRNFSSGGQKVGSIAGRRTGGAYTAVGVHGRQYLAHRLAFKIMTGREPGEVIDHINGDKQDNRWANLREATLRENSANSIRKSESGIKGVTQCKRTGKWLASITFQVRLGRFDTKEEAADASRKKHAEVYGEFSSFLSRTDAANDNASVATAA